jgi:hypothetical protein
MNLTKRDLLADEVNVDLDVLSPTVMNRVGYHVYNIDVVTKTTMAEGSDRWRS